MFKQFASINPRLIQRYFILMMAAWTVLIIAMICWGNWSEHRNIIEIARHQAMAYHNRDQTLRLWEVSQGGTYVPADGRNIPDPNLAEISEGDFVTASGQSLALMSPAIMLMQTREINSGLFGNESRVTSLQPIRRENAPDAWEREALMRFATGAKEAFEVNENPANPYVRLMKPLYITEGCLGCHGYQQSRIGEVGGGLSVTVPLKGLIAQKSSHARYWSLDLVFVWLLGMFGLGLAGRNINAHLREVKDINARLSEKERECAGRMALFEAMFNSITPDSAVFLDTERRIVMANQIFYERTGYSSEELIGRSCEQFYLEPGIFEEMQCLYETGNDRPQIPYEMEYRLKDGSIIQTETMTSVVKQREGEVLGCLAIIRDISERKKKEEEIRQALERTKAAEIAANAGSWSWNLTTGDLKWSENLCSLYGISSSEFDGRAESVLDFIHPDDRRKVMEDINEILREKKPRELNYRIITPGGVEKYIMSDTNLQRDRNGEIEKIIGMMRDVTEKKKIERERELNQERLHILLKLNEMTNATTEEIIQFGVNECIRLTGSNSGFCHLVNPDEELQKNDLELFRWSGGVLAQYTTREEIRNFLENEGIWNENFRLQEPVIVNDRKGERRRDLPPGRIPVNRYVSVPVFDQERLLAIVWVANKKEPYDETDVRQVTLLVREVCNRVQRKNDQIKQKELEYNLQRMCKMEAIGTLAGGIAHDFNNILAIILVSAEVAMQDIAHDNPARVKLERIVKASDRAKDIVKQILTYSRQAEQKLTKIHPERIVQDTLKLLKSTTPATIELVEDITCECGMIEVDPSQFHQVIMNLFTNAIHAMDEVGTLKVSSDVVELDEKQLFSHRNLKPGKYYRIAVQDDGIGMDKMTVDRIFDPFFTTKEIDEGTGMGLSIVTGIVRSHNGMIHVESSPGEGTTFYVYFPLADCEEKQEKQENGRYRGVGGKILLVDDEEILADITGEMLKLEGYQINVETDSTRALEVFRTSPDEYDLVITDHTMPKMTGMELARALIEIRPGLPVILLTGYNKKVSRESVLGSGIRDLLYKPYDRNDLLSMITRVI